MITTPQGPRYTFKSFAPNCFKPYFRLHSGTLKDKLFNSLLKVLRRGVDLGS